MTQVQPPISNSHRLDDKVIAIDALTCCKSEALRDAYSIVESSHSAMRRIFTQMNQDHIRMHEELFQYAHRHGWYPVPVSTQQVWRQLPRFQPMHGHQPVRMGL